MGRMGRRTLASRCRRGQPRIVSATIPSRSSGIRPTRLSRCVPAATCPALSTSPVLYPSAVYGSRQEPAKPQSYGERDRPQRQVHRARAPDAVFQFTPHGVDRDLQRADRTVSPAGPALELGRPVPAPLPTSHQANSIQPTTTPATSAPHSIVRPSATSDLLPTSPPSPTGRPDRPRSRFPAPSARQDCSCPG